MASKDARKWPQNASFYEFNRGNDQTNVDILTLGDYLYTRGNKNEKARCDPINAAPTERHSYIRTIYGIRTVKTHIHYQLQYPRSAEDALKYLCRLATGKY